MSIKFFKWKPNINGITKEQQLRNVTHFQRFSNKTRDFVDQEKKATIENTKKSKAGIINLTRDSFIIEK